MKVLRLALPTPLPLSNPPGILSPFFLDTSKWSSPPASGEVDNVVMCSSQLFCPWFHFPPRLIGHCLSLEISKAIVLLLIMCTLTYALAWQRSWTFTWHLQDLSPIASCCWTQVVKEKLLRWVSCDVTAAISLIPVVVYSWHRANAPPSSSPLKTELAHTHSDCSLIVARL